MRYISAATIVLMLVNLALAQRIETAETELPVAVGGLAKGKRDPKLEVVARIRGAMPAGVTVSKSGRIFVSFPRWGNVDFSVAELTKDGQLEPFPNLRAYSKDAGDDRLVSIQGIVFDDKDRLWLLDTSNARLRGYDLNTREMFKRVALSTANVPGQIYANDLRIDTTRGSRGFAFISDSVGAGVIVVDLATGECWRRLQKHPSSHTEENYVGRVEGRQHEQRGSTDGIALSADGKTLYYSAFSRRELYSVSADALANRELRDEKVEATVKLVRKKPSASDGICTDEHGFVYTTDYETCSVGRWNSTTGTGGILVQDERLLWPDALWVHDGYVYITCNQLNRTSKHLPRQEPYTLFRYPIPR
jgi:sugar lactone lactonase YvrE